MSTTASLPNVSRNRVVAATGALVEATAATVTLAVSGGDSPQSTPAATPAPAAATPAPGGVSGADQFHHFRQQAPSATPSPATLSEANGPDRFHHFR
jgi:hypothetical protein